MITRQHALHLRALMEQTATTLSDEEALTGIELFSAWVTDKWYEANERLRYGEKLYRCVIAHTSQASWTPDITPALWTEVSIDEFPEWVQPTGAQDAYNTGDKVSHNEKHWVSDYDANTWEPGVFGWSEVTT